MLTLPMITELQNEQDYDMRGKESKSKQTKMFTEYMLFFSDCHSILIFLIFP